MCVLLFSQELSARVKFTQVVTRLEKISNTKDHKTKAELVSKFFKSIFDLQKKFRDEVGPDAVSLRHFVQFGMQLTYVTNYILTKTSTNTGKEHKKPVHTQKERKSTNFSSADVD